MTRELFTDHALDVAPRLLGARLTVDGDEGSVTIRITEVEAYHGVGVPGPYDAGSHSRDRRTERNAAMFGPPGHAYVYFSYGMHFALNMVCSPEGIASGVLIRSGEVIEGRDHATRRRLVKRGAREGGRLSRESEGSAIPDRMLACGPGNLATALGITRPAHNGRDLLASPFRFAPNETTGIAGILETDELTGASVTSAAPEPRVSAGPRVGVAGVAGGPLFPWRFWIPGDPTVSTFRPGRGAPRA